MLFQTLDDKRHCVGYYLNGNIVYNKMPPGLTRTWNYIPNLREQSDVKYAQLYCAGKNPEDACPPQLQAQWKEINNKLKAFLRATKEAKISLQEHCFFDMVPEKFLLNYCNIKNKICNHIFDTYEKPVNYDFLLNMAMLSADIKNQPINVDFSNTTNLLVNPSFRKFRKKFEGAPAHIDYNIFGTKTGRLTTKRNSFPILTMDKEFRKVIKPQNDWFVEFDINAAELRVMLGLLGKEQPQEDLHEWNLKNVYKGVGTRDEAKKRIFAWLYNPESKDRLSNKTFDRESVVEKYFNGSQVTTFFDRKIEADEYHALNYIIQSTAADMFHRQAIKVWKMLENKKSNIAFCIHDSLVLDFSEEDMKSLVKIKNCFAETEFGKLVISVSVGKNFNKMKKLNLQNF